VHDFDLGRLFDTSEATESHQRLFVGGVQSPVANSASCDAFKMRANHSSRSLAGNRDVVTEVAANIRIDPKLVQCIDIVLSPRAHYQPLNANQWQRHNEPKN
jgi:hypothetical protein